MDKIQHFSDPSEGMEWIELSYGTQRNNMRNNLHQS